LQSEIDSMNARIESQAWKFGTIAAVVAAFLPAVMQATLAAGVVVGA
jgi:hypothetical protein